MDLPLSLPPNKRTVVAVGSALMDVCIFEPAEFVAASGAQVGGMVMTDHTRIEGLIAKASGAPHVVPGGSACNTAVGVGRLGGPSRFVGKRGGDALGRTLSERIAAAGVEPVLLLSPAATGRVLSIITPNAQRSMLTCLGASAEIKPEEVVPSHFDGCAVAHVEGYLLFNPDLFRAVIKTAKAAGASVSLDLASYNVVEASLPLLNEAVDSGEVDILIANEDEAAAFTGIKDEEKAAAALGKRAPIAVMKLGKRGSVIMHGGGTVSTAPHGDGRPAVDTTGAGDLWASGFLYGLVNGYSLERCGILASMCGYEVCQVAGAHIPEDGWDRIKKAIAGWG
jgi:sugar/nucleoside kinase (ribokinase family)